MTALKFDNKDLQDKQIREIRIKEAEESAKKTAKSIGLPYINLAYKPIQRQALSLVPKNKAIKANLATILMRGESLVVVVYDPKNLNAKEIIAELSAKFKKVSVYVVSQFSLEKAWAGYAPLSDKEKIAGEVAISLKTFNRFTKTIASVKDLKQAVQEITQEKNVSFIVELLLASSIQLRASDIHVEPAESAIRFRLRVDGLMQDPIDLDAHAYKLLLSRIKLLSNLKLNIHKTSQDGRFEVLIDKFDVQIRTSILPGEYGENIVLRILNPQDLLSVEELGIRKDLHEAIQTQLKKTNGMILTTGPTGSGKTTTLYAFLKKLKTPQVKIVTVEDPIEYHLDGISQTQVSPEKNYTFASGLRAILRQDPDVILIGEIRDLETANTAIQASLTGHLLLSTLHTNDAAGVIPRLTDIGSTPSSIGPAINMAIAQRLIRKLCDNCKSLRVASAEEISLLEHVLGDIPTKLDLPNTITNDLKIAIPGQCEQCENSGYKGRIGIYEILVKDQEFEKFILTGPSITEVREFAAKKGMTTLKQDGFIKILEGITTIEEVERVVGS